MQPTASPKASSPETDLTLAVPVAGLAGVDSALVGRVAPGSGRAVMLLWKKS